MKKQLLLIIIGFLCLPILSKAQGGVGLVSKNAVVKSLPSFVKDLQTIDSLQKKYSNEIQYESALLQENIRTLLTTYNPKENEKIESIKKRMVSTDSVKLNEYLKKGKTLENRQGQYETLLTKMQKDKIEPIMKKIDATIQKVAEAEQLDAMFILEEMGNMIGYFNAKKDYTAKVIAALKTP